MSSSEQWWIIWIASATTVLVASMMFILKKAIVTSSRRAKWYLNWRSMFGEDALRDQLQMNLGIQDLVDLPCENIPSTSSFCISPNSIWARCKRTRFFTLSSDCLLGLVLAVKLVSLKLYDWKPFSASQGFGWNKFRIERIFAKVLATVVALSNCEFVSFVKLMRIGVLAPATSAVIPSVFV